MIVFELILLLFSVLLESLILRSGSLEQKFMTNFLNLCVSIFLINHKNYNNYNNPGLVSYLPELCQVLTSHILCCSQVRIAMVGKYTGLSDAYLSVLKVHYFSIILSSFPPPYSQQLSILVVDLVYRVSCLI
jgi:hypothetical protein